MVVQRGAEVDLAAHGEVALGPARLALLAELVPIVEAGYAAAEDHGRDGERVVRVGVVEAAVDPHLVVVAQKVEHGEVSVHVLVAAVRVRQLPVVVVVERGPQRLGQLVVGAAVQQPGAHVGVVVAVHELAEQRAVGLGGSARLVELPPKVRRHLVRDIEPPPVDVRPLGRHPEPAAVHDVRAHVRVLVVQLGQTHVAFPTRDLRAAAGKLPRAPVPVPVLRLPPVPHHVLRREVIAAGVVEHAVDDHPNPQTVARVHHGPESLHGSEPRVQLEVIRGVVPVAKIVRRAHERTEVEHRAPEPREVLDPSLVYELQQTRALGELPGRALAAAKAERLDRVHHALAEPARGTGAVVLAIALLGS